MTSRRLRSTPRKLIYVDLGHGVDAQRRGWHEDDDDSVILAVVDNELKVV
jgi:hypothetical protein